MNYPHLDKLGVTIINGAVLCTDLDIALISTHGESAQKKFNKLFGVQTGIVIGGEPAMWASDCEAVLERMATGKLTSSQLFWD